MEKDRLIDNEDLLSRYLGTLGGEEYMSSGQPLNAYLASEQSLTAYPSLQEGSRQKTSCNTITISGSAVGPSSDLIETQAELPDVTYYVCDPSGVHIFTATMKYTFSNPESYRVLPGMEVASTGGLLSEDTGASAPDFRMRGYFFPVYKRRVLFSQEVEITKGHLPRLKPKIVLDRRSIDREE